MLAGKDARVQGCTLDKSQFFKCEKSNYVLHFDYAKVPAKCKHKCELDPKCTSWNVKNGCQICAETSTEVVKGASGGTCTPFCKTFPYWKGNKRVRGCDKEDGCICKE